MHLSVNYLLYFYACYQRLSLLPNIRVPFVWQGLRTVLRRMHVNSLAEIIIYFEDVKLLLLSSV